LSQQDQKTEQPTQQRLQKTRREGRFPVSRDLIAAFQFLSVLVVAFSCSSQAATGLIDMTRNLIRRALVPHEFSPVELQAVFTGLVFPFFFRLFLAGLGIMAIVTLIQLASTGFGLSVQQLMPDLSRLNPLSKITQLPKENLHSTFRSIILLVLVSYFFYSTIGNQIDELSNLATQSLSGGVAQSGGLIGELLRQVAEVLVVFGIIDLFRQRSRFRKNLRMTKQEVKDELKDTEGNTQMKLRIRRLQRDAIRRNMIKAVQNSSVVIVNPTHYAIALQYEMGSRSVPAVVAKGKNYLAKIIRERAKEHDIPIVENKPLAQALYQAVDIGGEIPPGLYRAVAEVLAQIYRIVNRQ
jgi:flagellar biosynthesis protein FlhB